MRTREIIAAAKRDGRDAGREAASWAFDGNTSTETYRRILTGYNDGDPEILDMYRLPNLSGEYADEPTPRTLQEEYAVSDERWELIESEVCDAWENATSDAFWRAIIKTCKEHVR